jgi:hypothetical protein
VDTAAIVSQGYQGATQEGEFAVYRRPIAEVTELPGGGYDGYYVRGDPFPSGLGLIFAWKPDGTVYVGTDGIDDEAALATLVDGFVRLPQQERFVGDFIESNAFRLEMKNLLARGFASGITAQQLDPTAYTSPFDDIAVEVFHRFEKPVYRVASAVYLQGIAGPQGIYAVMRLWSPYSSWATGTGSRSFGLTISGGTTSYAVAVANNDNGNSSAVSINGQPVVANNHCCENYWRRSGQSVSSVGLTTTTGWSQGAPQFNLAVVADSLSVTDVTQSPAGGLSANHPPLVSRLAPQAWTPQ